MISRIHISAIVFLAAVILTSLLIADGITLKMSWLRYPSIVISFLLILLGAFDMWLWRLRIFRNWFVNRPDISGTWQVIIQSDWINPKTGKGIDPFEGYMAVHQTFSSLSMRLMTDEMNSELIGSEIIHSPDRDFRIAAIYRSEPHISLRHQSPIHNGAFLLHIIGTPVSGFNGHYWTDRSTMGQLRTIGHRKEVFHDFQAAKSAFGSEDTVENNGQCLKYRQCEVQSVQQHNLGGVWKWVNLNR